MRRCSRTLGLSVVGLMLVGSAACGSSPAASPSVGPTPVAPAPLQPGDAIRVSFSREPDQSGEYSVDETGSVALPFLGARSVRDLPPNALKAELMAAYDGQLRNQTIEVRLLRRVRVLGAVRNPGLFHVDATMTLADMVAQAGGVTDDGKLEDIRIMRGSQVVRSDVAAGAGAFEAMQSGDQVFVPRKSWFSRNAAVLVGGTLSALGFIVGSAFF